MVKANTRTVETHNPKRKRCVEKLSDERFVLWEFYDNGVMRCREEMLGSCEGDNWKCGVRDGLYTDQTSSGVWVLKANYKNGVLDGDHFTRNYKSGLIAHTFHSSEGVKLIKGLAII